ncbi:HNH endonuclease signature motif containing protein [Campylobacter sp. RM16190]|uniref:HNH endonuclease n=1 Tax=Campylobacter sp. RM16190 TaxID=1705727 RepID=UPI001472D02C|nr:HNH endonuclease signature motif containing protein [Campylobacter sp. RM16190]
MPTLFKRCTCGVQIKTNERLCDKCRKAVNESTNRVYNTFYRNKEADRFYQSKEWKKTRILKKQQEPFCRVCGKPTEIIDHITPIEYGGAKLELSNLQGLCRACHNRKTANDKVERVSINVKKEIDG